MDRTVYDCETGETTIVSLTDEEIAALTPSFADQQTACVAEVMALREDKVAGGFSFSGTRYQTRDEDRENIAGAAQLAFMAVVGGAKPGNLRWADPATDFCWIAEDNSLVPMDAPTVIAFGKAAASFKQACIFTARAFKNAIETAPDAKALATIDINSGWPEAGL